MTDLFASLDNIDTLTRARSKWADTIKGDGGKCPCCDRWGKIYARSINATMARSLIWLAGREKHGIWVDVANDAPRWLVRSNQLPTLRWWGLVERAPNDDPHKKHSGMWRATTKGRQFVHGMIQVPQKVFTYDGEPADWSDDLRFIADCFKDRFDYEAVMAEIYKEARTHAREQEHG